MTDWTLATKDNLHNLVITDVSVKTTSSPRLSVQAKSGLIKTHCENEALLRKKLGDYALSLTEQHATNAAVYIGTKCNLSESTIRKVFKGVRPITRDFLGKFCVGLKLSKEESEELFILFGHPLDFNSSYFDAVTMTAIIDRDDIDDYEEDLKFYTK